MRALSGETEYLVTGCHGKLPFWPEYLDLNVAFPASRAFRDWIRDGREAAGMGIGLAAGLTDPLERGPR